MAVYRYFFSMDDHIPASRGTIFPKGAIVNGNQSPTNTVTVHNDHEFQIGNKFLYALTRQNIITSRVFTITAKTTTTITFSGAAMAFTDQNYLVPLGTDTGGVAQLDGSYSPLNWDGSSLSAYSDGHGDTAYTNATAPIDPGGECGFWATVTSLWFISRASSGKPLRVYPLMLALASTGAIESDALWQAAGDLAVGEGLAFADRLPVGNNGDVLTVDHGETLSIKWAAPTAVTTVATDAIWDTKGDIAAATGANAAVKLVVGTNGDVLTAASGETTGLKWVTPKTVATDTLWDTKGDLAVATGSDAASKLGVGTNDYVLTAASGEATGMKWAPASGTAVDDSQLQIAVSVFH